MKLYISDEALLLIGLFYFPVVAWLLWRLWKRLPPRLPVRLGVTIVALLIAVAIPLWDVVITSAQMAELCPKAGVFVKRSVKVDGYMLTWGVPDLVKRGFKYIESRDNEGQISVYTQQGDRIQTQRYLEARYQPISRYELKKEAYGTVVERTLNIDMDKSVVRDRATGEELGYSLRYRAYPGWIDRHTIARLGQITWRCPVGGDAQEVDLERSVLMPN